MNTEDISADFIRKYKQYFFDYIFDGLTAVIGSQDSAFEIIRQRLEGRTRNEIRAFANKCAEKMAQKHSEITNGTLGKVDEEQMDIIINSSLDETYNEMMT